MQIAAVAIFRTLQHYGIKMSLNVRPPRSLLCAHLLGRLCLDAGLVWCFCHSFPRPSHLRMFRFHFRRRRRSRLHVYNSGAHHAFRRRWLRQRVRRYNSDGFNVLLLVSFTPNKQALANRNSLRTFLHVHGSCLGRLCVRCKLDWIPRWNFRYLNFLCFFCSFHAISWYMIKYNNPTLIHNE